MDFEEKLLEAYSLLNDGKVLNKLVLPKPNIQLTTVNTNWPNVKEFLKKIVRPPKHFIDFLADQLDTDVNQKTDSLSDGLIMKGKHKLAKISPLIEKYMNEYVICKSCTSYESRIKKDDTTRKWVFNCKNCKATYTL